MPWHGAQVTQIVAMVGVVVARLWPAAEVSWRPDVLCTPPLRYRVDYSTAIHRCIPAVTNPLWASSFPGAPLWFEKLRDVAPRERCRHRRHPRRQRYRTRHAIQTACRSTPGACLPMIGTRRACFEPEPLRIVQGEEWATRCTAVDRALVPLVKLETRVSHLKVPQP